MHGTVTKQLEVLKDDAHLPSEGWLVLYLESLHVEAKHVGAIALDGQLAIDALQERRLSAAHLTGEIDHLAFFDAEIHFTQD